MSSHSERRPPTVASQEIDLTLPVSLFATGWDAALARAPKVEIATIPLEFEPPKAVSIRIGSAPVKTFSFVFPEAPHWRPPTDAAPAKPDCDSLAVSRPNSDRPRLTRIHPPSDIIKLEDRLYYLLQPSLETIISQEAVRFPFEPFPYQLQGIAFLYPRFAAILADEMGLGKTMQAITTIRLLLLAGEVRNVLLVCPKPLVTNWRREFALWAPELPVGLIEGDQARRRWQWRQPHTPVKLANYELLMRDRDVAAETDLHFDLVVLDEAQRIKNRSSTTSEVVRSISRTRSWALTGTPVENSSEDLLGIFEFLSPNYLSADMRARELGNAVRDYILRRTKDKVLTEMPPKLFRDAEVELTPEQWATYQSAEEQGVIHLNELGDHLTVQHVFELVLRLKQICNFDPLTGASAKMERLSADLEEVAASRQKAIVFSQWVSTLRTIRERIEPLGPLEYHGQIPSKRRDAIIDQFKADPSKRVILMSYGAGSVGLNLQFCRYVFLFDRWWNPAVEDQAINRAHRIGVAGSVTVTRFLALSTIEERINQVLEEKRELFNIIFSGADAPRNHGLTQDQIFGLFNLQTPKGPLRKAG
jgi:SNF2 family DNA or RNA helicase